MEVKEGTEELFEEKEDEKQEIIKERRVNMRKTKEEERKIKIKSWGGNGGTIYKKGSNSKRIRRKEE